MRNMSGLGFVLAVAVFGVSAVVFGATAVNAIRTEDHSRPGVVAASPVGESALADTSLEATPDPAEYPFPSESFRGNSYPGVSEDEILGAINQDLFQPDRTPPLERYLLPSERMAPVRDSRDDRRRREPSLRIVGTAIAGDRAIAMVQPEDSIPYAVLLGEVVDGYTLTAITHESVTLVRDDTEFIYPVMEPDRGRSSNRNENSRDRADTEAAARALSERAQLLMQNLQRGQMMRGGGGQLPQRIEIQGNPFTTDPNVRIAIPARGGRGGGGGGGDDGGGDGGIGDLA